MEHFLKVVDEKNKFLLGDAGCSMAHVLEELLQKQSDPEKVKEATTFEDALCNETNRQAINAATSLLMCLHTDLNKADRVEGACADRNSLDLTNCRQMTTYAVCRAQASGKECGEENATTLMADHMEAVSSDEEGNCKVEVLAALRAAC